MTLAVINTQGKQKHVARIYRPVEQVQGFPFWSRSTNFEEIPSRSVPGEFANATIINLRRILSLFISSLHR